MDPETTEAEEAFDEAFDNVVVLELEPSSEPEYDWDPTQSDIA